MGCALMSVLSTTVSSLDAQPGHRQWFPAHVRDEERTAARVWALTLLQRSTGYYAVRPGCLPRPHKAPAPSQRRTQRVRPRVHRALASRRSIAASLARALPAGRLFLRPALTRCRTKTMARSTLLGLALALCFTGGLECTIFACPCGCARPAARAAGPQSACARLSVIVRATMDVGRCALGAPAPPLAMTLLYYPVHGSAAAHRCVAEGDWPPHAPAWCPLRTATV